MRKLRKRLFLLFVLCLPFNLGVFYNYLIEADLIYAFDVILVVLYILWFVDSNGFSKQPIFWGKIIIPFVLLFIWTLMSAINAVALTMTGLGIYLIIKAFLIYLYIINNIRTKEELRWFLDWLLVGLSFQGFLGIVQYTTGSSLGLDFLGAIAKTRMAGVTRVRGTIGMPNQFGAWLALQIPIAVSLFIFEMKTRKKLLYGAAAFLGSMGLLLSFSRSAWAGLIASAGIFVLILAIKNLLKPKYILMIFLVLVVLVGLVIGFWDTIMLRFETGATGKFRLIMIEISLDIIKDNFFLGVGLRNYKFHQIEHFRFWHPVHNSYLRLAAETGIPGLLFFLLLLYTSMREGFRMLRKNDRFVFTVALGSLCSLWAFIILVNFGPEYRHYEIKCVFWIILAVIISLRKIYNHNLKSQKLIKQNMKRQSHNFQPPPPNQPIALPSVPSKGVNR